MTDENKSIFETIDELKKNTALIKKIGEIAEKVILKKAMLERLMLKF